MGRGKCTYLICVVIRRTDLDSCGEVEDDLLLHPLPRLPPRLHNSTTHLHSVLLLRLAERLRAVLVPKPRPVFRRVFVDEGRDELRVGDSEGKGLGRSVAEDDGAEGGAEGVVHVDYDALGSRYGVKGTTDEVFPGGCKNLRFPS